MKLNQRLILLGLFIILANSNSCGSLQQTSNALIIAEGKSQNQLNVLIDEWYDMAYYFIKHQIIGPPEASRIYAYMGVGLNEANAQEYSSLKSFVGYLNQLEKLPKAPTGTNQSVVTVQVLHDVLEQMLINYLNADDFTLKNLLKKQLVEISAGEELEVKSVEFAKNLSTAILDWAKKDDYLRTRDEYYESPSRDIDFAYWDPTNFGVDPLEPFWGELRTFVIGDINNCHKELKHPYTEKKNTEFYQEAKKVYQTDLVLSEDQRDMALFWADCPGETATPAGHWMYIIKYLCQQNNLDIEQKINLYSLTGIGIADAFIQCWHTKYEVNLLRPKTYIRENMDLPEWEPLIFTPPFPEYVSGHSVISSCASKIIERQIGALSFTDSTHVRIGLEPRRFDDVIKAAGEARESRLYGGMHFPMANVEGLYQGECVADQLFERLNDFF